MIKLILTLIATWAAVVAAAWLVYYIWNEWLDLRERKGRNPWDRE